MKTQAATNRLMNCSIERKPSGWYLTFPQNHEVGLILSEREEQVDFLNDCGIPAIDPDLDRIFRMFEIHECPLKWYQKALTPPRTF
jgi:hypothetical protein